MKKTGEAKAKTRKRAPCDQKGFELKTRKGDSNFEASGNLAQQRTKNIAYWGIDRVL